MASVDGRCGQRGGALRRRGGWIRRENRNSRRRDEKVFKLRGKGVRERVTFLAASGIGQRNEL